MKRALLLSAFLITTLRADLPDDARVDLIGETDQVEIEVTDTSPGAKAVQATWRKEMATFHINATFPLTKRWEEIQLTFVPKSAGKVTLSLAGPNVKGGEPIWVGYDEIEVKGAEIKNSGFEELSSSGNPVGWYMPPTSAGEIASVGDTGAAKGHGYARVWHGSRFQQVLLVEEGKPVTVTLKARLEKE